MFQIKGFSLLPELSWTQGAGGGPRSGRQPSGARRRTSFSMKLTLYKADWERGDLMVLVSSQTGSHVALFTSGIPFT